MTAVGDPELLGRADELRAGRTPYVLATVVRVERPASARPGDRALVLADGTIEGFVGGTCAESTTRVEGLRVLASGEPGLLWIRPGGARVPAPPGVRTVDNPCLSGGALELLLEPVLPAALVLVLGDAPVARALVRIGAAADHEVRVVTDPAAPLPPDTAAVVVASHGRDEPEVLTAALRAGVPYVALVASRRRAAGVLAEVAARGVPAEDVARVHAPAGLDIGARTPAEIALSIYAQLVESRPAGEAEAAVPTATDPVCGMAVATGPAGVPLVHDGRTVHFCGTGCRDAFLADPARLRRMTAPGLPVDVDALRAGLDATGYLADDALATALFLAVRLGQPILLEGEPGVGKTQAAKALAEVLDTPLLRVQCHEGITAAEALYEWNYPRQLLSIRLAESRHAELSDADLFTPEHLLARPLLAAIEHPGPRPAVLLVDEIDRADDEFEAFLLELLAESAVTIPELGTRRAAVPPVAVLTSNRTRDLHDALKRRCLYHWIAHPGPDRVAEIVRRRVPEAADWLAARVAGSVQRIRGLELLKAPGVAEAISWANALHVLGVDADEIGTDGSGAEPALLAATERSLGAVLKYDEDVQAVRAAGLATLLASP